MAGGSASPSIVNHVVSLSGRDAALSWYAEVSLHTGLVLPEDGAFHIGVTRDDPPATDAGIDQSAGGVAYRHFGSIVDGGGFLATVGDAPALVAGDVVGIAVKAGKLWMSLNGSWILSGDPSAGTGELTTLDAGTYFIASCGGASAESSRWKPILRTATFQLVYTVPTGCVPFAEA